MLGTRQQSAVMVTIAAARDKKRRGICIPTISKNAQVTRYNLMVKLKNECKMVKSSRSKSTRVFEIHSSKEVRYTTACREPRSPPSSLHVSKKNILPNPLTSTPAFLRAQIEKQIDVPSLLSASL